MFFRGKNMKIVASIERFCLCLFFVFSGWAVLTPTGVNVPLVSIDSIKIMRESKAGKDLDTVIRGKIDEFQGKVARAQQDLLKMQENLSKQTKVLSVETREAKVEEIAKKKKKLDSQFSEEEEDLKSMVQKEQLRLRDQQLVTINKISKKEGWGVVIDKNAPGVLCVLDSTDKTDIVLKEVDAGYAGGDKKDIKGKVVQESMKKATMESPKGATMVSAELNQETIATKEKQKTNLKFA
jgi:outer membrane protein